MDAAGQESRGTESGCCGRKMLRTAIGLLEERREKTHDDDEKEIRRKNQC